MQKWLDSNLKKRDLCVQAVLEKTELFHIKPENQICHFYLNLNASKSMFFITYPLDVRLIL